MTRSVWTGVASLLAATSLLAACGSSGSGTASVTSATKPVSTTLPASGPQSAFCSAAAKLKADFDPFAAVTKGGSAESIETGFVQAATTFGLLHASAPATLQPAFDELQKDILAFARDVDRLKWDASKVDTDQQTSSELSDPRMRAAMAQVRDYLKTECRLAPVGASANLPN